MAKSTPRHLWTDGAAKRGDARSCRSPPQGDVGAAGVDPAEAFGGSLGERQVVLRFQQQQTRGRRGVAGVHGGDTLRVGVRPAYHLHRVARVSLETNFRARSKSAGFGKTGGKSPWSTTYYYISSNAFG